MVVSFIHTMAMDWLLPAVQPTGMSVEMATVVVVGFNGDKITYEHIYWDQASVLKQLGLVDFGSLPVTGAENAQKVLNAKLPSPLVWADLREVPRVLKAQRLL